MNEKNFGEKIKTLRIHNKITQEDLAAKLNVTRQAVSNWERGKTIPDINMIENISNVFSIGIDEIISGEINEIQRQYNRKSTTLLYILSIILVAVNIVVSILIYKSIKSFTIFPVIIIFVETTIFFTFGNVIKNDDFSIIAGFDSKIEYNIIVLRKILYGIENHTMISSNIFISIFIVLGHMTTPRSLGGIMILLYIMEFVGSIILINVRNQDNLFVNNKDTLIAMMSNYIVISFIGSIILIMGLMIYFMEIYHIQNNSIEALKIIGIMIPYVILSLFCLFNEQKRVKENVVKDEIYRPSKLTYISIVLCILLVVVMVVVTRNIGVSH